MSIKKLKFTANVARTHATLARLHVNRLRVPAASVIELRLTAGGGKQSNSYTLDKTYTTTPNVAPGPDDFHFAPGGTLADANASVDAVKIAYNIENNYQGIVRAKLELFRRGDVNPFWTRELTEAEYGDGPHELPWDGRLDTNHGELVGNGKDLFPDQCLTVEHSPYKLKLTLGGGAYIDPAVAFTYFDVLVHSITLEWGPEKVLDVQRDKDVWTSLVNASPNVPLAGAPEMPIYLDSDIYKVQAGILRSITQMIGLSAQNGEMYDNTGFEQYKLAWGNGPNIPLFAVIKVKSSQDAAVDAPLALGKTKFLWDWEPVAENTANQLPWNKDFLDRALNYKQFTDNPRGTTCHKDHGGKRGAANARVLTSQLGETPTDTLGNGKFPFKVEACPTRKWAVFSYAWTTGEFRGKTGVMFQPSRMAGDGYKIAVSLADSDHVAFQDIVPPPAAKPGGWPVNVPPSLPAPHVNAAPFKIVTGAFRVWRQIHISKYVRKVAGIPDWFAVGTNLADVQAYYSAAFINVVNRSPANVFLPPANYDGIAKSAIASLQNAAVNNFYVDITTDQFTADDSMICCRPYVTFRAHIIRTLGQQAADIWMVNNRVSTAATYDDTLDRILKGATADICNQLDLLTGAQEGVTVIQFNGVHNIGTRGSTNGRAMDLNAATRNTVAFIFWHARQDTFAHEIGHHLFLPHAKTMDWFPLNGPAVVMNIGARDVVHDSTLGTRGYPVGLPLAVQIGNDPVVYNDPHRDNCLMSYARPRETFCGFCQLRLRGWSADIGNSPLQNVPATNEVW